MKALDEIITSFTPEELRKFKHYLNGTDLNGNDAYHDIIESIRKGNEKMIKKNNSYLQFRKRLRNEVEKFLILEVSKENTPKSSVLSTIQIALKLFNKNLYLHGWEYLFKAEQIAKEQDEYALVEYIYNIQIELLSDIYQRQENTPEINDIIQKRFDNFSLLEKDGNVNAAYALLIFELYKHFENKKRGDINAIVTKTLSKFNLSTIPKDNVNTYSKIVNIVCHGFKHNREYINQKNYSLEYYDYLRKNELLNKVNFDYKMRILNYIINSATRCKEYTLAEEYAQIMEENILSIKNQHDKYLYYLFMHINLKADIYIFTNRARQGLEMLNDVNTQYKTFISHSPRMYFIIRVNSITSNFLLNNHENCIKLYNEIRQLNNNALLKALGVNVSFYTDLFAVLFYIETKDLDHALYLLNKLKRQYAVNLSQKVFSRDLVFLSIIHKVITVPKYINSKKFASDTHSFVKLSEYTPGDEEYISLNAWLLSKLKNENYYSSFLSLI